MEADLTFSDVLTAAGNAWNAREDEQCLLSLALPLRGVDPLKELPNISKEEEFCSLWDQSPGFCLSASGICQHFELLGPRRFELAQSFSDITFSRLINAYPGLPLQASPRILFKFSFFDQISEKNKHLEVFPAVHAVLPKWQLTNQGTEGWLRINGVVTSHADSRELSEQLWMMFERLVQSSYEEQSFLPHRLSVENYSENWKNSYETALFHGIDLVKKGELEKIVLAVKQSLVLQENVNPLLILSRLRKHQAGSCRFLWQRNSRQSFFGASPERLLSLYQGNLCSDALAGTAIQSEKNNLLNSQKDRLEHALVVESIINQLKIQGFNPDRPTMPKLTSFGELCHLHTPITARAIGHRPLSLVKALHPTPAVAGLPRAKAMSWLRALEPFERGSYAAPIGWIDSFGNCEFRVAIRCANSSGKRLDLIAGAGLVKGSVAELELKEVELKLAVLADHLDLKAKSQLSFPKRL